MEVSETKRCPKCGETKPLSEYYQSKNYLHGYSYSCKNCLRIYSKNRARRLAKENPRKQQEYQRRHDERHKKYCVDCGEQVSRQSKGRCPSCSSNHMKKEAARERAKIQAATEEAGVLECRTCKKTKPLDQFYKSKERSCEYEHICKSCRRMKDSKYKKEYKDACPRCGNNKAKTAALCAKCRPEVLREERHRKILEAIG